MVPAGGQSAQYAYPDGPSHRTGCRRATPSPEDRSARVHGGIPDTCDGIDKDDVCTNNIGYRGCALQPMERELSTANTMLPSLYHLFKQTHTDDGRSSAAVMSALGVNINTAYLSQCPDPVPTEWTLETQLRLDGLTPVTSPSCGARGLVTIDNNIYTEGCATKRLRSRKTLYGFVRKQMLHLRPVRMG